MEDIRDLKSIKTEMYDFKILLAALKKMTETHSFKPDLKKRLMFLISPLNQEDLPKLEKELNQREAVNLLGLSSDMLSQLNTVNFTKSEILLIQELFNKELPKLLNELSTSVIEFDSELTALAGSFQNFQPSGEIVKLANDIPNLVLNSNSELKNNVQLQDDLIKLKYETIPGKELKEIENCEKELKDTLLLASDLHEKTLNTIYPSEDFHSKIDEAVSSIEQELLEVKTLVEELSASRDIFHREHKKEFNDIAEQYREITNSKKMLEMTFRELKLSSFHGDTSANM